jgi:putative oxidoreductase
MYLAHSLVLKLMTLGLTGTAQFFVAMACRPWLAYVTFAAEALGGSLLILGVQTRWIAIALTPALLGAIIRAHGANGWAPMHWRPLPPTCTRRLPPLDRDSTRSTP